MDLCEEDERVVSVRLTILFGFLFRHFQWVFGEGRLNRIEGGGV